MKDEIKEILDGFKEILDNPTTTDECYDGRIIEINRSYDLDLDEIKSLLDYITNLQTIEQQYSAILSENAELENKINNLQIIYDKALTDLVHESHKRIELENKITNLQEELKYQKEMEEEYNKKHTELMNMYSGLKAENETLRSDFKNQVECATNLQEETERLKKEIEQCKKNGN